MQNKILAALLCSALLASAASAQSTPFSYPDSAEQDQIVAATYCLPGDVYGCADYQRRERARVRDLWVNPYTTDADRQGLEQLIEAVRITLAGYRSDSIIDRYFADRPTRLRRERPVTVQAAPAPSYSPAVPFTVRPVVADVPRLYRPARVAARPVRTAAARPRSRAYVSFANCSAARAAGAAPIRFGEPGYARKLDRDGDGVACE